MGLVGGDGSGSVRVADCAPVVGAVQAEIGVAMKMTKERLAGTIKVGFTQGRVDYTETVYRAFWPSSKGARRAGRPLLRVVV